MEVELEQGGRPVGFWAVFLWAANLCLLIVSSPGTTS